MSSKTKSPKKQKKPKLNFRKTIAITGILTLSLLCAGYFIHTVSAKPGEQSGQLDENQTSDGEDLRNSLDLRLAGKASYPSAPITLVKDYGVVGDIKSQIVSFAVPSDKLTEYGLLYLPTTPKPAGGYPVLILCHGYIKADDYLTPLGYLADMEFYAKNGFAVLKPDFRGQGLSANQGVADSAYYSMAYNTDLMSLITAVKDTNYLDKSKINLWGHSMGAYIALRASVLSPDIKNTIILAGPVGSLNQMYVAYVPPSDENNPIALKSRQAVFSKYGTPGENTTFWKNASPTSFLANTNTTYEINVGLQDPVVPPSLSMDFDNDLSALHRTHEYFAYADGRHNLIPQRQLIWSRSLALLKRS